LRRHGRTPTLVNEEVTATVRMMSPATNSSRPMKIDRPVDGGLPGPTVKQRACLTPSSTIPASSVWCFYALQLVDEFPNASGYMLVECAGSD
jgi:hypothetical protein